MSINLRELHIPSFGELKYTELRSSVDSQEVTFVGFLDLPTLPRFFEGRPPFDFCFTLRHVKHSPLLFTSECGFHNIRSIECIEPLEETFIMEE